MAYCVIGHARRLWPNHPGLDLFLRLSMRDEVALFDHNARVRDPKGKARQLEAIARRHERRAAS